MKTCLTIALTVLSLTSLRVDDIKTINGREYKGVTVTRVEPDALVIMHSVGVSRVPFSELPKSIQEKYHYDPSRTVEIAKPPSLQLVDSSVLTSRRVTAPPPAAAPIEPSEPPLPSTARMTETETPAEETPAPAESQAVPYQKDDPQFEELRKRDWYEDLKRQEKLKNKSDFTLELMDSMAKNDGQGFEKCTPTFFKMLDAERKAHRANHKALSSIAAKIMAEKNTKLISDSK